MMKKLFLKLHLYLGFPLGILLSIICLTGAILVFKDDISELLEPNIYRTEVQDTVSPPLSLDVLVGSIERDRPNAELGAIVVPQDKGRNIQLKLKDELRTTLYIDPYTAKVRGEKTRGGFFIDVMRLHRWLLGSKGSIGQYIVAYATLGFVLILISGIILWIPKNKKQLRTSLKVKFNASRQRLLRDLHVSLGFYLSIILLVLSFTGLYFSPIKWVGNSINAMVGVPTKVDKHKNIAKAEKKKLLNHSREHWDNIVSYLLKREPNAASITLEPTKAIVSLYNGWGNMRAYNEYSIDPTSGTITPTKIYAEQPTHTKVRGWIYTIHTGAWGGWFSKVLTFIVSLCASTLPLTGYYLYIKKRRKLFNKNK